MDEDEVIINIVALMCATITCWIKGQGPMVIPTAETYRKFLWSTHGD